jgi:hypothetical protein
LEWGKYSRTAEVLRQIKKWWPAIVCTVAYYTIVLWCIRASIATTGGHLVYPLDDTYIHMAMAKNFSDHGVWGYTRYAFSSSTTSPFWTATLALGYFILGHNEWLPLFYNLLVGTVLIAYLFILLRDSAPPLPVFFLLLAITAVTSVPALTLLGMEHLLHALLTLMFVCVGAKVVAECPETLSDTRSLLPLAALLPMTRYEGCFAVAWVCSLLFLKRRPRHAVSVAAAGALPVLLYGALSVLHGWLPFLNSILLKGHRPSLSNLRSIVDGLGLHAIGVLTSSPLLLLLLVLSIATCLCHTQASRPGNEEQAWWRVVIFLGILFLHLQFANVGWLFRYEAYLVAVTLAITLPELSRVLPKILPRPRVATLPLVAIPMMGLMVLAFPFAHRAKTVYVHTTEAMYDRYLEHIQIARFVLEFYPASTIVVNDIGAIAYFTDCRLLDMYGLGNMEPVRYRMSIPGYTSKQVEDWARTEEADIAILQIEWGEIRQRIPGSWRKVAELEIPRNVVFGDTRIGFFAVKPTLADSLASRVPAFRRSLPEGIQVKMMPNRAEASD